MSRSRRPLPIWAVVLLVVAGIGWQLWRARDATAVRESARPAEAAPADTTAGPALRPAAADEERRDLSLDERRGGHTLARHVGRTDEQLRERLDRERSISAASTYTDRDTAERIVARALKQQARRVEAWRARDGNRPNLAIDYRGSPDVPIGRSLSRGHSASVACTDAVIVLRWSGDDDYVLTSYPEARR